MLCHDSPSEAIILALCESLDNFKVLDFVGITGYPASFSSLANVPPEICKIHVQHIEF